MIEKADKIATGHNADDIAETILLNMIRGDLPRCAGILLFHLLPSASALPLQYTMLAVAAVHCTSFCFLPEIALHVSTASTAAACGVEQLQQIHQVPAWPYACGSMNYLCIVMQSSLTVPLQTAAGCLQVVQVCECCHRG